jgi:RNA polymerase sigma factor (TIGR02999 family)
MSAMAASSPSDVTQLLAAWRAGDEAALDRLMPLVYDELRRLARRSMRSERPDHTLSASALVHEAYLRLVDQTGVPSQNRAQFFGIAAHLMRQILVQHARRHQAAKRGGGIPTIPFDEGLGIDQPAAVDLVALEEALTGLEARDPRKSRIVELRFYGGLSIEETAEVLGVSERTVKREWRLAKAWLFYELTQGNH